MFLTAALCLVVLMTAVERNKGTILFPLALGFALWATQLAAIQYTGEWFYYPYRNRNVHVMNH